MNRHTFSGGSSVGMDDCNGNWHRVHIIGSPVLEERIVELLRRHGLEDRPAMQIGDKITDNVTGAEYIVKAIIKA